MKNFVLFNYMIEINGRMARLVLEPGTPWEDVFYALEKIKEEMLIVKENSEKKVEESPEEPQSPLEVSA